MEKKPRQVVLTIKDYEENSDEFVRVEIEVKNCNADDIMLAAEILAKEASKFMARPIGGRFN